MKALCPHAGILPSCSHAAALLLAHSYTFQFPHLPPKSCPTSSQQEFLAPYTYPGARELKQSGAAIAPGGSSYLPGKLCPDHVLASTTHSSTPQKMFFPFKAPSSPPKCFKLLVPSSALRGSRQKYWSSIFPAETHPGKLWETSNAGRKEGILQSWAEPPYLDQTKYYTLDRHQNSRSSGNFKATPSAEELLSITKSIA